MKTRLLSRSLVAAVMLIVSVVSVTVLAQAPARNTRGGGPRGPVVISPEVSEERHVTFRILAPNAETVRLSGSDLPGVGQGAAMTKDNDGVWSVKMESVRPGAYRYNFNVDGVSVIDPRNPASSESNENIWSLVYVPGAEFMDTKDVPHGAISELTYWSSVLNRFRRLHVYTPPGYESGEGKYPIFYLLHGAFDSDDSWSTVGRAGFILDNLIAAKKAKPMVIVMPHGHTGPFRFGERSSNEFEREFTTDIMPLVEKRYRVHAGRQHRAMAGLSMGGGHTLSIGMPHLEQFAYLGVFSSGIFGIVGRPGGNSDGPSVEERYKVILDEAVKNKDGLKLFWFATGKDDFLIETSRATVELFKKRGFDVTYKETDGAHTWIVWREYLNEFAPQLFK